MTTAASDLPTIPGTNPDRIVLDSFRTAIARRLADKLGIDANKAYEGIDYGKKGEDFTVALPRFRLSESVAELAARVINNVSSESCSFIFRAQ